MSLTYQAVNSKGINGAKVTNASAKKVLDCNSLDDRDAEDLLPAKVRLCTKRGQLQKFSGQ